MAAAKDKINCSVADDFGEIVFRFLKLSAGIVLLRLENEREDFVIESLRQFFAAKFDCRGNFVVVSEKSVRIRKISN